MPEQQIVDKTKVQKKLHVYSDFAFVLFVLVLLSSLLASQNILASNSYINETISKEVGYAHLQQDYDFSQAQIAFENQDYVYSARLLAALAENGHVQAQYLLATQYDAGLGISKNEQLSFYWYKKAAKAGVTIAQHNLAVAYAQGNGIKADTSKAITWWKRAAIAGNTDSQFNLGIIYASGRGLLKPNMKMAMKWWHMAAINGDAAAQFNLGAIYANGIGVSTHTCQASHWWKKSAKNGFAQAEMALAVLQTKRDYRTCQ